MKASKVRAPKAVTMSTVFMALPAYPLKHA